MAYGIAVSLSRLSFHFVGMLLCEFSQDISWEGSVYQVFVESLIVWDVLQADIGFMENACQSFFFSIFVLSTCDVLLVLAIHGLSLRNSKEENF